MMRKIIIALVAVVALAGCTTTIASKVAAIDAAVARNLPATCSIIAKVHVAFSTAAMARQFKANLVLKEKKAWAAVSTICADPANVIVANAPMLVADAYVAMLEVKVEAGLSE